jgi:hypothetical protein
MRVMPRDVFEELHLPLKPMAMCLELENNSIRYPVGISKDAPVKVGEIKFNIYDKGSTFKFQPRFKVCNTSNVKYVPPHHRFIKEEPKKKEEPEKVEVVASVKTEEQSQPVKTKKMTKPKNKPAPKMVRKWVPKIATPTKSVDPK